MSEGWRKSGYSNGEGGDRVETRLTRERSRVAMRDTRNRELGHLSLPAGEWAAFLGTIHER
ncbi:DUF397 domain-containing protein [Nocardiopsis sp. Huas11]|uniref:DUF397 domain-containing protein n=1 Tax=Nocardiopsis sp. Huas11 TaxID=2183912 RepID=UPI003512DE1E